MYQHAVADGILTESENPAARVPKPRRLRSTRTALPDGRLEEILRVAAATGDDPALDALLLRLHTETACRRGGALALMPEDLDAEHCLIRLHEKGETVRWQPVSPTLMSHLLAHGESRGGLALGRPLLRYANGRPISSRRYDYLWRRLGLHLPWVATQQVSMHWIRHTTLTWVERNFGFATAQAYAGHEDHGRGGKAMATYVRAGLPEVATALAALTGEDHPLAISPPSRTCRRAHRNEADMSPATGTPVPAGRRCRLRPGRHGSGTASARSPSAPDQPRRPGGTASRPARRGSRAGPGRQAATAPAQIARSACMITIRQLRLPGMDKPLAELAACFRSKSRLPDQDLVRLTAAARAAGSRWEAIAAACGIQSYEDLAGVVDRITGETGADLLFSATQYAVEQLTAASAATRR